MYIRDGQQMPESEEGAAFFKPMGEVEVDDRVLGLQRGLLTHGFVSTRGLGADDAIVPPPDKPGYAPVDTAGMTTGEGSNTMYWILGAVAVAGVWIWSRQ